MTLSIAHRGVTRRAPENTLAAFRKAIEFKADIVEFDVHLTKDGKIVVHHDHSLERSTDGAGLVGELTFKKIRTFHKANGEPIPSLQEVFSLLKGKCILKIDIKDKNMEKKIINLMNKNGIKKDSVIISSRIVSVLKKIKSLDPEIITELGGYTKKILEQRAINMVKGVPADIISPHITIISKKLIDLAHKNGLKVHVWTVNDRRTISKMKRLGVDAITTTYPERI